MSNENNLELYDENAPSPSKKQIQEIESKLTKILMQSIKDELDKDYKEQTITFYKNQNTYSKTIKDCTKASTFAAWMMVAAMFIQIILPLIFHK